MNKLILGALAAASLVGLSAPSAHAATPKCGGQDAARATPYSCYNERVVGGVLVRVNVHVDQAGHASVLYSLPNGPIDRIIGLQISAHAGLSSSPATKTSYDTMPAGADTFPLAVTFPATGAQADCRNQFDIKAWPGHQGTTNHIDAQYRVSGATFTFPGCTTPAPPTTIVPLVPAGPPPSGPGTTVTGTTGAPAAPVVPSTKPSKVAGCTLNASGIYVDDSGVPCNTPATGFSPFVWLYIAVVVLSLGGAAFFSRRIKAS